MPTGDACAEASVVGLPPASATFITVPLLVLFDASTQ